VEAFYALPPFLVPAQRHRFSQTSIALSGTSRPMFLGAVRSFLCSVSWSRSKWIFEERFPDVQICERTGSYSIVRQAFQHLEMGFTFHNALPASRPTQHCHHVLPTDTLSTQDPPALLRQRCPIAKFIRNQRAFARRHFQVIISHLLLGLNFRFRANCL
jgi:hypothetical protein